MATHRPEIGQTRPDRTHPDQSRPPARAIMRRYVPPQHGAWAMLALPFVAGVALSRPTWLHLPLLVAWFGGYLLSYYALLAVKTRRPGKVAPQLRLYGGVTLVTAALVVALRPAVLWFAPAFAVLLAINAAASRRRDDRALVSGLASVALSCLMVPVAAVVAESSPRGLLLPTLIVFAYFAGSLLYVKTMIRNRGETGYLMASTVFHLVATVAVAVVALPLGVLFALLTARAAVLPGRPLTPKQVGLLEVPFSLTLLVGVVVLFS